MTTPDLEVGSYTFVVAVKDDGYPSKIDRQEFEIEIEEPEEEVVEEAKRAAEAERRGAEKAEEAKRASVAVKAVEALQETVKRRLARKGISLPPLCGCPHARTAKPFAMDHVYKCARNCPLRGDEAAYRAALAQMLAAHDIVVTPPPLPV